jgi:hypothetical protein
MKFCAKKKNKIMSTTEWKLNYLMMAHHEQVEWQPTKYEGENNCKHHFDHLKEKKNNMKRKNVCSLKITLIESEENDLASAAQVVVN